MLVLHNPWRGAGLPAGVLDGVPAPSRDAGRAEELTRRCPRHGETPLVAASGLARRAGVGAVFVKDERGRMGLGSFKALGAAYVIARDAEGGWAKGRVYVTASAGNHGMSVAAGASAFGARSVVYIAETVPEAFARRLAEIGAEVRREGATYEASMAAADSAAGREGMVLLSDSSWPGYVERPGVLMEGYLVLMAEAARQIGGAPSHVFVQAGVGGLATAVTVAVRDFWGEAPRIVVVEPEAAAALTDSIRAGRPVEAPGPVSSMGRLDCKVPSLIALGALAAEADDFGTIGEDEAAVGVVVCAAEGLDSTPSGAAGIAALLAANGTLGLDAGSRVLTFLSEGPEG